MQQTFNVLQHLCLLLQLGTLAYFSFASTHSLEIELFNASLSLTYSRGDFLSHTGAFQRLSFSLCFSLSLAYFNFASTKSLQIKLLRV